jgi:hypothetical protein
MDGGNCGRVFNSPQCCSFGSGDLTAPTRQNSRPAGLEEQRKCPPRSSAQPRPIAVEGIGRGWKTATNGAEM